MSGDLRDELGAGGEPRLSAWPTPAGSGPPPVSPTTGGLGAVIAAGRSRSERLDDDVRVFLLVLAIADSVTAALHGVVLGMVAGGHDWWQRWADGALTWPHPAVQPVLAVTATVVIAGFAVATGGFTRTRPWQSGTLVAVAVVGTLTTVPLVLFVVGWVVAIAVAVAVGIGLLVLILASS